MAIPLHAFLCTLIPHEHDTLNFITQWSSYFLLCRYLSHSPLHNSSFHTLPLPFNPFEFRDTGNMTMNDATGKMYCCQSMSPTPSTFSLPLLWRATGVIHRSKHCQTQSITIVCVWVCMYPIRVFLFFFFQIGWALVYCVCVHVYFISVVMLGFQLSHETWVWKEWDMKEKFYKKEILW